MVHLKGHCSCNSELTPAVIKRDVDTVERLLKSPCVDVNDTAYEGGNHAIMEALKEKKNRRVLVKLLTSVCDINLTVCDFLSEYGWQFNEFGEVYEFGEFFTPLMFATSKYCGDEYVAELLRQAQLRQFVYEASARQPEHLSGLLERHKAITITGENVYQCLVELVDAEPTISLKMILLRKASIKNSSGVPATAMSKFMHDGKPENPMSKLTHKIRGYAARILRLIEKEQEWVMAPIYGLSTSMAYLPPQVIYRLPDKLHAKGCINSDFSLSGDLPRDFQIKRNYL